MSLSLDDFVDLIEAEIEEPEESLGDRLSGTVDAEIDSVEEVRDVRESV